MITLDEFAKNFNGLVVPDELVKLLDFQNEISKGESYSDGFYLIVDTEKTGLKTYSEDKIFLSSILEFASADYTGSTYGFWLTHPTMNLNKAPIACFGSEGGFHIITENIRELLQILTFDSEPMIDWDEVSFYKDSNNHIPSDYSEIYKQWLKTNFNLEPIENLDLIIKKAQDKYQKEFQTWIESYYQEQ